MQLVDILKVELYIEEKPRLPGDTHLQFYILSSLLKNRFYPSFRGAEP